MHALRLALYGTATRRWVTCALSVALFYAAGAFIHDHIDTAAGSPGMSFVLVAAWVALGAIAGLCSTIALGDLIFHRGFSREFLRDEMAELDARISGEATEEVDDEELELATAGRDAGIRFGLYFLFFAAAHVMLSDYLAGGFFSRYSHPGVAVVHMRSDDPTVRREGMNMLATRLDFEVTPEVEKVVLDALGDADEGVAARAAFVAGTLEIDGAADTLAGLIEQREALAFTGLIALGQIGGEQARQAVRRLAETPNAQAEPQALALALGLLKVPAIARLKAIRDAAAEDDEVRLAAIWALAQLKDPRLLDDLAASLDDGSLAVRCAAAYGLRDLVKLEAYAPLKRAFETADPAAVCPEKNLPVQEGGRTIRLVPQRNYMLTLLHGLASTDHPELLVWLVKRQDDTEDYKTRTFMKKLWEDLKAKEKDGRLNHIKRNLALQKAQGQALDEADGGADGTADGGTVEPGSAPDGGPQ